MLYDIKFEVQIPGIATRTLTRSLEAATVDEALMKAKRDMVLITVQAINPAPEQPAPTTGPGRSR